jgi:hypothetical protein
MIFLTLFLFFLMFVNKAYCYIYKEEPRPYPGTSSQGGDEGETCSDPPWNAPIETGNNNYYLFCFVSLFF